MASDRWRTIVAFLLLIALHAPAYAQPSSSERAPASVGVSLQYMRPRGGFRENTRGAPWGHRGDWISSFDDADGSEADTGAGYRMYGTGVRMPIRSSGWSFDLASRHHEAGLVSYRRARLNLDGSLDVDSVRSRIPFDLLTLGFQYRFAG